MGRTCEVAARFERPEAHVLLTYRHLHRGWYFSAEQPAPAPHLAHPEGCAAARPEGCAALRVVLVTLPRVSRSCEHFPDGFDLHLLPPHAVWVLSLGCVVCGLAVGGRG